MATNGKSNTFLLGRIYERTEQTAEILPIIQQDIRDMKGKQSNDFYEIKDLKKEVKIIKSTSISCVTRRAIRNIVDLIMGRFRI